MAGAKTFIPPRAQTVPTGDTFVGNPVSRAGVDRTEPLAAPNASNCATERQLPP